MICQHTHVLFLFQARSKNRKKNQLLRHVSLSVVRPSFCMINSASIWRILMKLGIWPFSKNLSINLKFHYNLTRIMGIVLEYVCTVHLWQQLAEFFLEWEMFQTKVVQKIETHILCSINLFPRKSCRLWDNVEKCGKRRRRHMHLACWITKATKTHS